MGQNRAKLKKLEVIFKELVVAPYMETVKSEQLKGNLSNYWSRRINKKNRFIYTVKEDIVLVKVLSAIELYNDK